MRWNIATEIVDAAEADGIEIQVYENYSGRGMMGVETTGLIVHNIYDFTRAVAARAFELGCRADLDNMEDTDVIKYEELQSAIQNSRWDNLGNEFIFY